MLPKMENGLLNGIEMHNGGSNGTVNGTSASSGRTTPNDPAPNKMFVGGLSWQTTHERLREYFGAYGTVTDVLIMKDPVTQRSRGFGFITFADASSVERVISQHNHMLDGKKIDPKHATPKNKGKANRTKKIFVGGVSQETSSEEVRLYFSQFGKVEEAVMLMDNQTRRHRGFGFVTFDSEDVVDRVCDIHFHTIKSKKVECKKAQPKEAVQAANLLQKRVLLGNLGATAAATQLAAAQAAHVQAAAAAQAVAAQTAAYGKLMSVGGAASYPGIGGYRYAPYPLHPINVAAAAAAAGSPAVPQLQQLTQLQQQLNPAVPAAVTAPTSHTHTPVTQAPSVAAATAPGAPGNPYQGYNLTNVDMSSFQGVDWSAMYGMGMYA